MRYKDLLAEEMEGMQDNFRENELAYLALTSKVELPVRDKLAYNLHRKLWDKEIVVSREWRRSDLAFLKEGAPVFICELKAAYTFDIFSYKGYLKLIEKDITKAKSIGTSDTEIVSLFLTTHVHQTIDTRYKRIIKYDDGINNALKRHGTQVNMIGIAMEIMKNSFSRFDAKAGIIPCGKAFNYDVEIYYWIFSEQNLIIDNAAGNGQ